MRKAGTRIRTAYGAYAARRDEDACSIDTFRLGIATRPVRWVRALIPKPRPLARLSLCEGGTLPCANVGLRPVLLSFALARFGRRSC